MKEIKNVSIIGMGALGVMYGSHLAHHMGFDHVTYIMDEKRYEKYKGSTVTCNGEELSFTCVPASQAVPADLVIVAVKSTGLTEALDTMKNCIGPDTVILSVMNGISSEEIIGERYGAEHMIYAVAQGMDAMNSVQNLPIPRWVFSVSVPAWKVSRKVLTASAAFLIEQSFLMYGKRISFTDSGANSC